VYPAIAIADAIRQIQPGAEILFVGTRNRMEWQTVPKSGYAIKSVWISGFHRRLTPQNLLFPMKLATSIVQSYSILNSFRPDVMISCGGFAAGPIGWVAARRGVPIVLQEQNSFPGVTNRLLAKYASVIFTAFENAKNHLPAEKVRLEGNPVRQQLSAAGRKESLTAFGFKKKRPVLLVLGGSGGAAPVSEIEAWRLGEAGPGQGDVTGDESGDHGSTGVAWPWKEGGTSRPQAVDRPPASVVQRTGSQSGLKMWMPPEKTSIRLPPGSST
jgi:UDP-N-acetylglucosamine--N-acetylmuramyl-(pentapeptide) pyrophosphoryl-undecaprenol N-acetylglucosamine transferase